MKIYLIKSNNVLYGFDLARFLEADIALVEKTANLTVAYILTPFGDESMEKTMLKKMWSIEAELNFYPIPFGIDQAKDWLEKQFTVEYLMAQPDTHKESHVSTTPVNQIVIVTLQEKAEKKYRFTCQQCGQQANVSETTLGPGWRKKNFISFKSSCDHPNRFNVSEFISKYDNFQFR